MRDYATNKSADANAFGLPLLRSRQADETESSRPVGPLSGFAGPGNELEATKSMVAAGGSSRAASSLLHLQRRYGNRYVQRVLALARQGEGEGEVAPDVESGIEKARGGGQGLESGVRRQMESAFGADFSGVRVHTGPEAHSLNRDVNALAFTTGQDVFFRQGAYDPGSSGGRELLAHELTHVVQQGGAAATTGQAQRVAIQRLCPTCEEEKKGTRIQGKLEVDEPNDQYEQEADRVAQAQVARLNSGAAQGASFGPAQRKCACGGEVECTECAAARNARLKPSRPAVAPSVAQFGGQEIDPFTRTLMENRFGGRVHEAVIRSYDQGTVKTATLHFPNPSKESKDENASPESDPQAGGLQLTADVKIDRPVYSSRASAITDQGETSTEDGDGDIVRLGQSDGEMGGDQVPAGTTADQSDNNTSRSANVGGCTFKVNYANLQNTGCGGSQCGAQIIFDITGACGTGAGCPNIDGLQLTESVTTDNGCGPGSVTTGPGCPISSHPPFLPTCGEIKNCADTYALCGPPASFPAAGCTENYTQKLFIGGALAETHTITFTITRTGGGCSGSVVRN